MLQVLCGRGHEKNSVPSSLSICNITTATRAPILERPPVIYGQLLRLSDQVRHGLQQVRIEWLVSLFSSSTSFLTLSCHPPLPDDPAMLQAHLLVNLCKKIRHKPVNIKL